MGLEGRSWLAAWDGWVLERSGEADRGEDKGRDVLGVRCTWLILGASVCYRQGLHLRETFI